MMMKRLYSYLFFVLVFFGCKQLEDAAPVQRNTFLHFYERSTNYKGQALLVLADGFLIAGDVQHNLSFNTVITRTDNLGNVLWETEIDSTTTNSLIAAPDGYLVFGARIHVNTLAEQVNDVIKYEASLSKLDLSSGSVIKSSNVRNGTTGRVDFIGNALTMDANGKIYGTGLIRPAGDRVSAFVIGVNTSTLDTLWFKQYSYINRDYVNSKSASINPAGKILWASSARSTNTKSYLTIPVATPNGTFVNDFPFGALEDRYYSGDDISSNQFGYGIIGTYFNQQSTNANIFFVRTDIAGNYLSGSEKFFDGVDLKTSNTFLTDKDVSSTQDSGDAITATSDGGFLLAGSMQTTPDRGNGGQDIILIRMDAFGNVLWNKLLGGAGDESVRTVQTTANGEFVLCGTSSQAGLSSVFIMKVNSNGELKD